MMKVEELLQTAASPTVDQYVRVEAQQQLERAAAEQFELYMGELSVVLAPDSNKPTEIRMLAALALKNELTTKNELQATRLAQRWAEGPISVETKHRVKATAVATLADAYGGVTAAAAQLVAAIATIELPRGEWPELTVLLVSMTNPDDQASGVKKAALTTIGYICESANPANPKLEEQMNGFLTAIVQAAQKTETDESVRLAAINALSNSLEFIRANFAREGERNLIMMAVCEATQNTGEELQSAAFGCLAKIMLHYYEYMRSYMEQALFQLTVQGMQSEHDGVQCMAVEFWSTVSEVELDLQFADENEPTGVAESSRSFQFVSQALPQVLPTILKLLVKANEDVDEDEWNVNMAAGTCLELMAKTAGDPVLEITMQFVAPNIESPQWNYREASVMAFGSILDGPNREQLVSIVHSSLRPLAAMIKDPSVPVRETVAWCLGRIADCAIPALDTPEQLQVVIEAVVSGLQDDPKVVTHSCWAIMNLAEQLNPIPQPDSSVMSPFYEVLTSSLLHASSRADNEHSARTSAYEALSSLVIYAPNDTLQLVMSCSGVCDERLRHSLEMQRQVVSVDDRQNVEELQVNLLGLLTSIIRRVEGQVLPVADTIMELLAAFLTNKFPNSLVEDDVFIALGAIAGSIDRHFAKYVPALLPFIVSALNETEYSVSSTAVGLITDITHALGEEVAQYVPGFMQELSKILANFEAIRRDLIPPALACIGDLASASGPSGQFDVFLQGTEQFLGQISQVIQFSAEASVDYDLYVANVKEAILDAQVGIVAGYRDDPVKLGGYVPGIFQFLSMMCQDETMIQLASSSMLRSIVGLIGDLGSMYLGGEFKALFAEQWVVDVIMRSMASTEPQGTQRTGLYASKVRQKQIQLP